MIYTPSHIPSTPKPRPRDIERSRSSSTRTIYPIDCTDGNGNDRGNDYNQFHSSASIANNDAHPDINDVVLMDRKTANTDENVKDMTILLVGNSNAGKSSFVYWSRERNFKMNPRVTTGVEPSLFGASINGQSYVITLMDTAGTERFNSVPQSFYRYAGGVIVMYDITDYNSFKHVTTWKQQVEKNCRNDNIPYILVGNKVDIEDQLHIEGEQVAKDLNMADYLKTSALTGEGIDIAIKTIIALAAKSTTTRQPNQQIELTRRSRCC